MTYKIDETGNRYGFLLVEGFSHTTKSFSYWNCICDCGNKTTTRSTNLRRGKTKSCGKCSLMKKPVSDDAVLKKGYAKIKNLHKSRGFEVSDLVSYEMFKELSFSNCFYCGSPPSSIRSVHSNKKHLPDHKEAVMNGIDRIDSSRGYTNDNVRSCCFTCNAMKLDHSIEVFLDHVKKIYDYMELNND